MRSLMIVAIMIGLVSATQYTPLTNVYDGLSIGTSTTLVIEAFYDLLCPDSKESFFIFQEVLTILGQSRFQYIIHQFPLAYHKNAFTTSQGLRYLQDKVSVAAAYDYAEQIFINQDQYTDYATLQLTQAQVNENIVNLVTSKLTPKYQIDIEAFRAALKPSTPENYATRASWKFATHRNIPGTPQFLVNGVWFDGADDYNVDDWVAYIKAKNPLKQVAIEQNDLLQ